MILSRVKPVLAWILLNNLSFSQIKLPLATMSPPESLLRTDSLSSSEPVLSEGSVGLAPSLGLSPGPTTTVDYNRNEGNQTKDEMMIHQQRAKEVKKTKKKRGFS